MEGSGHISQTIYTITLQPLGICGDGVVSSPTFSGVECASWNQYMPSFFLDLGYPC
jgi:hypothetical protein